MLRSLSCTTWVIATLACAEIAGVEDARVRRADADAGGGAASSAGAGGLYGAGAFASGGLTTSGGAGGGSSAAGGASGSSATGGTGGYIPSPQQFRCGQSICNSDQFCC